MNLEIGKRYRVEHGTGTLVGYEYFTPDGEESLMEFETLDGFGSRSRYVFILDAGHKWNNDFKYYCTWERYISEIEDETNET